MYRTRGGRGGRDGRDGCAARGRRGASAGPAPRGTRRPPPPARGTSHPFKQPAGPTPAIRNSASDRAPATHYLDYNTHLYIVNMSVSQRTVLAVVAALAAVAVAMPADYAVPSKLDLSSIMNKTVCPIKVDFDVDESRVPKRIKVMKCAQDLNQWCSKMHIPRHECCQHQHGTVKLECVEVQDVVQVYFPKQGVTQPYRVSVGCTCVMEESVLVPEAEPMR